jgi:hypothetical protein
LLIHLIANFSCLFIFCQVYPNSQVQGETASLYFLRAPRHYCVLGEWRYSSAHSLTSAPDGGEWSASRPAALPPGKETLVPIG